MCQRHCMHAKDADWGWGLLYNYLLHDKKVKALWRQINMVCPFLLLFFGVVCGRVQSSVPQCRGIFDFYFVLDRYDDISPGYLVPWQNYSYIIAITTAIVNKRFIYLLFCYLQSHTIQYVDFKLLLIIFCLNTVIISFCNLYIVHRVYLWLGLPSW